MAGSPADTAGAAPSQQQAGPSLKRKRIRIPKSCIPCLKGKRACDRERPACGRCARSGQPSECVYDSRLDAVPARAPGRKQKAGSAAAAATTATNTTTRRSAGSSRDNSDDDDDDDDDADDDHGGQFRRHDQYSHGRHDHRLTASQQEVASLRTQLEAARRQTIELQELVRSQQRSHHQHQQHQHQRQHRPQPPYSATSDSTSSVYPDPYPAPSAPSSSRKRDLSRHSDLDAVTGLQMLAEMAGPGAGRLAGGPGIGPDGLMGPAGHAYDPPGRHASQHHPDAGSAAFYDRSKMSSIASVLNWPAEGSRQQFVRAGVAGTHSTAPGPTPPSRASVGSSGFSGGLVAAATSSSDPGLSPSSDTRSQTSTATSSSQSPHVHLAEAPIKDTASPVNRNGVPIYYGEGTSGDIVLRQVKVEHAAEPGARGTPPFHSSGIGGTTYGPSDAARAMGGHVGGAAAGVTSTTAEGHTNAVKRDIQAAFNRLLDPSSDTFPFATIWSSGDRFLDEVLPFFPTPDEFDAICQAFVRHFSAMCPALTVPSAIEHAREFSRLPREQQAGVPLPWLAVFLMICAMGINCDLENTIISSDQHGRQQHIDALIGGADPSRAPSAASSPAPNNDGGAEGARSHPSRVLPGVGGKARTPQLFSDVYLSATYQALRLCSFLSSPTLQTIHAQLLIGSYLLNTERASHFWPLLGSLARQSQSIGLHVDPDRIRPDWNDTEKDIRRRLWWAIVHQDVILSGIFGRPLGITRFNTRFPASPGPSSRNFAALQCELSQFARTCLDENQDHSWSQRQIDSFTERVQAWYADIPAQYHIDAGNALDPFGPRRDDDEAIRNFQVAGVDLNIKGLMEVHQSCNLAIEVSYVLLSLHRSNLLSSAAADGDDAAAGAAQDGGRSASTMSGSPASRGEGEAGRGGDQDRVNETSLRACTRYLREITKAQRMMTELLGRARAAMFWKVSFYSYQAVVVGAYIVFLRPNSEHAASALEDLACLTDIFDRMPDRWTGLKVAKGGLRVLYKLAVAARDNPEAASMPRPAQAHQPAVALTPMPMLAEFDPFGSTGVSFSGLLGSSANTPTAATTPSFFGNLQSGGGPGGGGAGHPGIPSRLLQQQQHHQQSGSTPFMLPIYHSSPGPARIGTPTALGASAGVSSGQYEAASFRPSPFSIEQFLSDGPTPQPVAGGHWNRAAGGHGSDQPGGFGGGLGQPTGVQMSTSGSGSSGGAGPSGSNAAAAYSGVQPLGGHGGGHDAAGMTTSGGHAAATAAFAPVPAYSHPGGAGVSGSEGLEGHDLALGGGGGSMVPNLNPKELATYWSDYFSLQLDWDRLSTLT
ncbi:uncharacterized protein PSFLO_00747 [Pseudozyma flocculosa]|uniref:Zn(2)-C6 fungal-type domain-containing protein n=1 Tax=Pseudozyma flocculosa TaxID=84751 RepID=A0A5C3EUM5_9BASI|nr:uncharacterized protein PSFLO_00747 [Pseudozyma flocculosa]